MTAGSTWCVFSLDGLLDRAKRLAVKGKKVAPGGGGFADVGQDSSVEEIVTQVRKVVFALLETTPRRIAKGNSTELAIDRFRALASSSECIGFPLEGRK